MVTGLIPILTNLRTIFAVSGNCALVFPGLPRNLHPLLNLRYVVSIGTHNGLARKIDYIAYHSGNVLGDPQF